MPPLSPQEVIEFVQEAKAQGPKTQAAIADLTQKFQALQERQIDGARERAPNGESLRRFIGQDGKVLLKSTKATETFAGRSVTVERDGLFDGAASNDTLDMFEEMRFAALLHKGATEDPSAVTARQAFEMATKAGAVLMPLIAPPLASSSAPAPFTA